MMVVLVVAVVYSVIGVWLFARGAVRLVLQVRKGSPSPGRLLPLGRRIGLTITEILSHRRFTTRPVAKVAHWCVMVSFVLLVPTLAAAYAQIIDAHAELPIIGGWAPWQWAVELFSWLGLAGIIALIVIRIRFSEHDPQLAAAQDWRSRFYGSTRWQAWFVEAVIAAVIVCVLAMTAARNALLRQDPATAAAGSWVHFPTTYWIGTMLMSQPRHALELSVGWFALAKIVVSMTWMGVVGAGITMSVAWHRFLSILNVYARRELDGSPALGAAAPMLVDGKPFDIRQIDDLAEDATFGVNIITDFGWKGLLDFASCSECGRCQDVCPAWNTGKPLSPKLFTLALRDHAAAALGPAASATSATAVSPHSDDLLTALARAGAAGPDDVANRGAELIGPVINPDVLWACTTCGACTLQCPVDIEHVDHILDLRRGQVMTSSQFPEEFGGMFSNLEQRANPWGQPARKRLDWTTGLDFTVPVVGKGVADLSEVDYLFYVGCAGAFDERAGRTTRAVAELLHTAGVTFAILGKAESCCGDPARRAGNEATYQELAVANIEQLQELGADKILVTCPHCYNTLANEYAQLGASFNLVHHTQLLNRLVREHRLELAPPDPGEAAAITYHDPCYLGRHNGEYEAPRELLGAAVVPGGAGLLEMAHSGPTSMCCGGGGGRMWTEETIGTRINTTRMGEATATGAATLATGCPYCSIMLGDAAASDEAAPEVRDVALMVLDSVHRAQNKHLAAASAATPSTDTD